MEIIAINFIGYSAAFFGSTLMLPQVIKTWKTKKVEDVSLAMLLFYFMNCLLWLIYAYLIDAPPLFLTNVIALLIGVVQIFFKYKY